MEVPTMSTLSTVVVTVGDVRSADNGALNHPDAMRATSTLIRAYMTDVYTDVYVPESGGVYQGQPEGTLVVIGTCTGHRLAELRSMLGQVASVLGQECIGLIVQGDTDTLVMAS
jgi:hypothetical protein